MLLELLLGWYFEKMIVRDIGAVSGHVHIQMSSILVIIANKQGWHLVVENGST